MVSIITERSACARSPAQISASGSTQRGIAAPVGQLVVAVEVGVARLLGQLEEPHHAPDELLLRDLLQRVALDAPREQEHVAEQALGRERGVERRLIDGARLDQHPPEQRVSVGRAAPSQACRARAAPRASPHPAASGRERP